MRPRRSTFSTHEVPPLVRVWLLRLLVPLGGHHTFVREHGFQSDALAACLQLDHWIDPVDVEFNARPVRMELRKLHSTVEVDARHAKIPAYLGANIARLAQLVGLSDAERLILAFAVLIRNEGLLDEAADWLGNLSSFKMFAVLSVVLDLPAPTVREALSAEGVLGRSGLISVTRVGVTTLSNKLDLISDRFADQISSTEADPMSLLRDMVAPASPGALTLADFEHLDPWLELLSPYLKGALASARRGVNIFFHGVPGTGKNELSKALSAAFGCELFEVASEDRDGDPINAERRLRAFRAAQSFFGERRALIVFDEVEDIFNDGSGPFGVKSTAQRYKAWINRMLEDNQVPTLWLSNSIRCLDPAFIRRFDMVIELPVPPRMQRERIIRHACTDLVDASTVKRLAESEVLAPAVVARAAAVMRSISAEIEEERVAPGVEMLIGSTLEAQGHDRIRSSDPTRLPEIYDPAFIQSTADLRAIAAGLMRTRQGRLCLYGPPGTGKTAYARWVATSIGVPIIIRRGSDILSMWLGEAEKNIASMFRLARANGAVLLLDEIDSFLQDRREAMHSWEVTMVNEMLTQMESFSGVFIASTNLVEDLDQAALRRFDLKVRFEFMHTDQSWALLSRYCETLAIPGLAPNMRGLLDRLSNLTPGDFAAVARQHRFHPVDSAAVFVAALTEECALKDSFRPVMGFI